MLLHRSPNLWILLSLLCVPYSSAATNSIPLAECVRAALKESPSAKAASWRIKQAHAGVMQTKAPFYPQVQLGGSYTAANNPSQAFMMQLNQGMLDMSSPDFDPNNPDDTENINLYARLEYRLYDGGQRSLGRDSANAMLSASSARRDAINNELTYKIVESYLVALKARELSAVQRQTIESLNESLRIAKKRTDAGTAIRTDVLNLNVRIAEQQQALIGSENAATIATESLNTLIGKPFITPSQLIPPQHATPETHPASDDLRPEQIAANAMSEAERLNHQRSRRTIAPNIDAFGQLDMNTEDFDETAESWFAGVTLSWDAFDGFDRRYANSRTEASWQAAREEERRTTNRVLFEKKQAHLLLTEAMQRLTVAEYSCENAEEALRMTQVQYEQGTADISTLLVAQVGRASAHTQRTTSFYDVRLANAAIMRAEGQIVRHFTDSNTPEATQ